MLIPDELTSDENGIAKTKTNVFNIRLHFFLSDATESNNSINFCEYESTHV